MNWVRDGFPNSQAYGIDKDVLTKLLNDRELRPLIKQARRWERGFLQSVSLAEGLSIEAEAHGMLSTLKDIKAICKVRINGDKTIVLTKAAQALDTKFFNVTRATLIAKLGRAAGKAALALGIYSAGSAAVAGFKGKGAIPSGGIWGAFNEVAREAMMADIVEPLAKGAGQRVSDHFFPPERPAEDRLKREHPWMRDLKY